MRVLIACCCFLFFACNLAQEKKELNSVDSSISVENENSSNSFVIKTILYSKDSLPITADIYEVNGMKPETLLCHQAGYSRGEYKDTALEFMKLGISTMAIDQRSGKTVNAIDNETAKAAKSRGLSTNYLDAKQDIEAAIDYLYEMNGNKPITLVGSSYSATLVLLIAKESTKVKAVIAFSPGEYFKGIDVKNSIKDLKTPTFVTSSKKEAFALTEMVSLMGVNMTQYIPSFEGIHGSRALWETTEGNQDYWDALQKFYNKNIMD